MTFVDRPPLGSILRAIVIPTTGGDTIWANTVAAYQDLPPHLRITRESVLPLICVFPGVPESRLFAALVPFWVR
ncbi:MAG: TauD/TfdA family dioxygenase [Chroococcidiopsidaceae cyanobacterium CP_BM_RX_35]|nr:TauD/TfdA family dioxygenase [Chroococcidiopsidaceae cyanobacterium CP_BM_RX_35]